MNAATTSRVPGLWKRIERAMGWTPTSYWLMAGLTTLCIFIVTVWWPVADLYIDYVIAVYKAGVLWKSIDWLLIGIWLVMSLLLMRNANMSRDLPLIVVCLVGGLVIEGWGTQTELWTYFTNERPPLWIIPAWPVAGLAIDRIVVMLDDWVPEFNVRWYQGLYWVVLPVFYLLMWQFVDHTLDKSLTIGALIATALLIMTPKDYRLAVLTFAAGCGLGYFLELWGTTRLCWTYYTQQTPPLFAVMAHGLAALGFWRLNQIALLILAKTPLSGMLPDNPSLQEGRAN